MKERTIPMDYSGHNFKYETNQKEKYIKCEVKWMRC